MAVSSIQDIEAELKKARSAIAPRVEGGAVRSSFANSMRFYHNSKTRHHALVFELENGDTAYKDLRDNALDVVKAFASAKKIAVWYDEAKIVQQFVLNYEF